MSTGICQVMSLIRISRRYSHLVIRMNRRYSHLAEVSSIDIFRVIRKHRLYSQLFWYSKLRSQMIASVRGSHLYKSTV